MGLLADYRSVHSLIISLSSITTLPLFIKYGFDPFCLQVIKLFALFFLFVISATQNIAFDVNSA